MKQRVYTLDYLRGGAALLILIYHYLIFEGVEFDGESFIRRMGYYGVTIFYILSGLTLFYVYNESFTFKKNTIKAFFIKRIARILPLLWLVSLKSIIFSDNAPNYLDVFLNLSGLFGFFKWDTYFATGAWSIGNELVFYAFFPFLLVAARKRNMLFWCIGAFILFISIYFSFYVLPDSMNQDTIFWRNYVNPLNQLIYFYSGIAIGRLFSMNKSVSKIGLWTVLIISLIVFICYPTGTNDVLLVIKGNRYVFFIACWLIVASLYLLKANTNVFIHKPLLFLGEISYGIYLFHPIVYSLFKKSLDIFHISLPMYSFILLAAILSIVISYLSYRFFETKCVKIANRYLISCSNKI
ncbi:hypothetical protein BCY89_15060 [Sphingobacterium siyangense]|uniref:Acyltransferase 3 domain-containing protein n=1 Tax=Sphingobacterium siyangense TaxID=459529 RepID=A0A420FHU8_9SPHI|nr:acyltransferase [Sphingobacterium siyangense]QRY58313.1 acyltransferase [Sphingobacterium siyangense]RKF32492.1 hypothetical protein BCY89_15060 [Sphingobacterium siyangense]